MSDMDTLYEALRNAKANGDDAAVARLAQYIDSLPTENKASLSDNTPTQMTHFTSSDPLKDGKFNFGASFKNALIKDPETKQRELSKSLGVDQVYQTSSGRPYYIDPKTQAPTKIESPSSAFLGGIAANTPVALGGIAGAMTPNPVVGSGLGAMVGNEVKHAIAEKLYDEPQDRKANLKEDLVEGGLASASTAVPSSIAKVLNVGRDVKISPQELAAAQEKQARIKASTGVDVDLLATSESPELRSYRRYMGSQPNKTGQAIQEYQDKAMQQLDQHTQTVLNMVAEPTSADVQGLTARNAAKDYIQGLKTQRDLTAKPYYDNARKVSLSGDVVEQLRKDPLLAATARDVSRSPAWQSDMGLSIEKVKTDPVFSQKQVYTHEKGFFMEPTYTPPKTLTIEPNPRSVGYWHAVKGALDQKIEKIGAGTPEGRIYSRVRNQLNQTLEAASPEYKAANEYYAGQTNLIVKPAENGIIGTLAKIKDINTATAAARIFQSRGVTAEQILRVKAALNSTDPGSFEGLARQYMEGQIDQAMNPNTAGEVVNFPGKMSKRLYGTSQARARMNAALGPERAQALSGLMETAETLAQNPIKPDLSRYEQAGRNVMSRFVSKTAQAVSTPLQSTADALFERSAARNSQRLWEAVSDPLKVKQLNKVMKIKDVNLRTAYIGMIVGENTVDPTASAISTSMDDTTNGK